MARRVEKSVIAVVKEVHGYHHKDTKTWKISNKEQSNHGGTFQSDLRKVNLLRYLNKSP